MSGKYLWPIRAKYTHSNRAHNNKSQIAVIILPSYNVHGIKKTIFNFKWFWKKKVFLSLACCLADIVFDYGEQQWFRHMLQFPIILRYVFIFSYCVCEKETWITEAIQFKEQKIKLKSNFLRFIWWIKNASYRKQRCVAAVNHGQNNSHLISEPFIIIFIRIEEQINPLSNVIIYTWVHVLYVYGYRYKSFLVHIVHGRECVYHIIHVYFTLKYHSMTFGFFLSLYLLCVAIVVVYVITWNDLLLSNLVRIFFVVVVSFFVH